MWPRDLAHCRGDAQTVNRQADIGTDTDTVLHCTVVVRCAVLLSFEGRHKRRLAKCCVNRRTYAPVVVVCL